MSWWKQKTTWTGIAAVIAALGGYLTDEISIQAMLAGVLGGVAVIFMRQGVAKAIPPK